MLRQLARLVLGTAQLGMEYGIANVSGRPSREQAHAIVEQAFDAGINRFDTSQHYGNSEALLGGIFSALGRAGQALVDSKLSPQLDARDGSAVLTAVRRSVTNLGCPLRTLYLHDARYLDSWNHGVGEGFEAVLSRGLASSAGVSVYSPERAFQALETPGITSLQIPGNVLDRRFLDRGVLERARELRVRVTIRSVFLQGLLLIPAHRLPRRMEHAKPLVSRFQSMADEAGLPWSAAALAYARQSYPDASILIGVDTAEQLRTNTRDFKLETPPGFLDSFKDAFAEVHESIVDPRLWPNA